MSDAKEYAAAACAEYEHWASEVTRLTSAIADEVCPNEEPPEAETHFPGAVSCFQEARENEWTRGTAPDQPPMPPSLSTIEKAVADCPSCSRLCDLIRSRRHARKRFGVAKRKVRHAGKQVSP